MSPAEWLPINLGLFVLNGTVALFPIPSGIRTFNILMAMSWCFWIGWNLAHIGCR